jgi:hypothetical protein|tara:strand:- start:429 stop:713 length:285 start_codon:yes stop_codon:yes gene_type:complete
MPKYITLDTASDGNVHINVDQILYAETASSTAGDIFLANGTHKLTVTGTGLTSGFGENVNTALVTAAETSWTNATVPVSKDGGLVFTSIAIGTI